MKNINCRKKLAESRPTKLSFSRKMINVPTESTSLSKEKQNFCRKSATFKIFVRTTTLLYMSTTPSKLSMKDSLKNSTREARIEAEWKKKVVSERRRRDMKRRSEY